MLFSLVLCTSNNHPERTFVYLYTVAVASLDFDDTELIAM